MADIKLKQGIRFFQEAAKETIEVRKEIERLRQAIVLEEVAARNGNPNPRRLLTIIESIQKQKTQLAFLLVNAGRISNTCERLLYTGINYRG